MHVLAVAMVAHYAQFLQAGSIRYCYKGVKRVEADPEGCTCQRFYKAFCTVEYKRRVYVGGSDYEVIAALQYDRYERALTDCKPTR